MPVPCEVDNSHRMTTQTFAIPSAGRLAYLADLILVLVQKDMKVR